MKNLNTNLKEAAVVFDKAMEKYKRNYDKVELTVLVPDDEEGFLMQELLVLIQLLKFKLKVMQLYCLIRRTRFLY